MAIFVCRLAAQPVDRVLQVHVDGGLLLDLRDRSSFALMPARCAGVFFSTFTHGEVARRASG